jgi:hypothetical protein
MPQTLDDLIRKDEIATVINRLFVATDQRDWASVRDCFDPTVTFDMTSVAGGQPATLTPDQIAEAWSVGLKPIEALHHQTGNMTIAASADRAQASCYGIAYHYRRTASGRNTRVFVGSYDFELRVTGSSWRIAAFKFNLKFIDGNLELEKENGA